MTTSEEFTRNTQRDVPYSCPVRIYPHPVRNVALPIPLLERFDYRHGLLCGNFFKSSITTLTKYDIKTKPVSEKTDIGFVLNGVIRSFRRINYYRYLYHSYSYRYNVRYTVFREDSLCTFAHFF